LTLCGSSLLHFCTSFLDSRRLLMATNTTVAPISSQRLWFGLVASAVAWVSLGCIDILINWRACMHQQDYGIPNPHPVARILIGVVALLLLAIAVGAGSISWSNWRRLSTHPLLEGEAVDRNQFVALLGVIVSLTLGVGIVWLAIPPLFLDICWRAR
jgi:hypothetical protein